MSLAFNRSVPSIYPLFHSAVLFFLHTFVIWVSILSMFISGKLFRPYILTVQILSVIPNYAYYVNHNESISHTRKEEKTNVRINIKIIHEAPVILHLSSFINTRSEYVRTEDDNFESVSERSIMVEKFMKPSARWKL